MNESPGDSTPIKIETSISGSSPLLALRDDFIVKMLIVLCRAYLGERHASPDALPSRQARTVEALVRWFTFFRLLIIEATIRGTSSP